MSCSVGVIFSNRSHSQFVGNNLRNRLGCLKVPMDCFDQLRHNPFLVLQVLFGDERFLIKALAPLLFGNFM